VEFFRTIYETKSEDPGACGINWNYNDGFADNNLESLFHDDMKYETGWRGYSAYCEIVLSMNRGSNSRACSYGRLVHRASSARCTAMQLSKGPQYPYPLSLCSAVLAHARARCALVSRVHRVPEIYRENAAR
jgi:hypothetical protein